MSSTGQITERELITRREAVFRVTALLGGVALVGSGAFLTGCREERATGGRGASSRNLKPSLWSRHLVQMLGGPTSYATAASVTLAKIRPSPATTARLTRWT